MQFAQFVLPHLSTGWRGLTPTQGLDRIFNYILQLLYMVCQWKSLPNEKNDKGRPEIHYTRIYRALRRWPHLRNFCGSVHRLHQHPPLDLTVIHGGSTTTAAKKGDGNLGYPGRLPATVSRPSPAPLVYMSGHQCDLAGVMPMKPKLLRSH
ncbi:hypothetical protein SAMN05444172_9027 [Burkholderia sp. GAS332]|nr:hypothetical protein SAMN05444172_9027 [Burkholderia sp. GAS332]